MILQHYINVRVINTHTETCAIPDGRFLRTERRLINAYSVHSVQIIHVLIHR